MNDQPLHSEDERLPTVRARLFLLVRSLWKAGILQLPLALEVGDAPALQLLHPLWRRLRIELLGERLLRDVLPAIERQLASAGELQREESGLNPRAPVDWPATWRRALSHPAERSVITRRWERTIDLPENHLAYHALQALAAESSMAAAPAARQEAALLRSLHEHARRRLEQPPWRRFVPGQREAPVREAAKRIRRNLAQRPAYGALLAWWQQWQAWRQPIAGTQSLLDPALEPDWLFELLLLFELVRALARYFPVRQSRALGGDSRAPAFVAHTVHGPLLIFYQSGAMFAAGRSLLEIWGVPDIVLQLPSAIPSYVILDAKNYGPKGHTAAIYKMLGYLYQFGYDPGGSHTFHHVHAGILAFPTDDREGPGLHNWQRDLPRAQAVMSFVLPPLADERFTGLSELVAWLVARLKVSSFGIEPDGFQNP
ncbi:MAG: hypothetical protein ACRDIB_17745 [Ardenticatenaceae bacterium]